MPSTYINNLSRSSECDVFAIRKNRKKVFLKIKRPSSSVNFDAEVFALKRLGELGVKVSKVVGKSDNFIIASENRGVCLNDRPRLFLRRAIYKDLAKDLQNFYSIKFNGFGPIKDVVKTKGKYKKWIDFFADIKLWTKTIKIQKLADIKSVEKLEKYWHRNSSLLKDVKQSFLVHGDFCLDHIFASKGSFSGIIDFGDTFAGDPLIDLAYFKFKEITKPYGEKTFKLLKESYEKYQRIGPKETKLINLYMIYWVLRRTYELKDGYIAKTFAKKLKCLANNLEDIS